MKTFLAIFLVLVMLQLNAQSNAKPVRGTQPWSQQLSATAMNLWKDSFSLKPGQPARWSYDQGVILKGIEGVWNATGDGKYFYYIQKSMDVFVSDNGTIRGYKPDEFNIDNVNNGKLLLLLYRVTGREKYKKAAVCARTIKQQPRTSVVGSGMKVYLSCGWMVCIWVNLTTQNARCCFMRRI
jgi:unsaturated rhamnogalacturonyl hydrolase